MRNDMHELLKDVDCDPWRLKQIAYERMLFVQEMIELVYTHGHNEARLSQLLTEAVSIDKLKQRGLIDLDYHAALLEAHGIFLNETELELSCLIYNGFSTHILRIIYEHSNPDSIYIRIHRVRTKIFGQMALVHNEVE